MHPFPPEHTLAFLVGKEIGQIALDPWSVQFRFADCGQITLEGKFEHVDAQGQTHVHQDCEGRDIGPVYLSELIQHVITALRVDPFCLSLIFDSGSRLHIHSDDGPYECGQIYPSNSVDDVLVF